jgi:hypothetical protein
MKRNELVQRLIKEGLSEKTLVNFSDKQLYTLGSRILGEATLNIPKDNKAEIIAAQQKKLSYMTYEGEVGEGKKPTEKQLKSLDKNKNNEIDSEDFKLLRKGKKKTEVKEEKPSAGLSKEKKSDIVKKVKKGEDIGKKGKGFEKIEKNAKESGAKDPKSVAAAAMWKNIKREGVEVKNWVNKLVENNYHSFTSKNEIMELIQTKMVQHEVGPNVKEGHNDVPEFMSYDAIKKSEVKEDGTKTKPKVKPTTKPSKPKTPYKPGPGKNPKPKALKEDK